MASTTMKRIASELGVSITTVSKVLNNHDDISPATRARVMAKVEELGYRPNAVARSLTLRRTHTLGVVIPDLLHSFFVDAIVREHVPDLTDDQITELASNQQHFIAITYTINAQSKEQVVALANALKANKDVIMLI